MSSPKAPNAAKQTKGTIQALTQYLPAFQEVLNQQLGPTAQAEYDASAAVSPKYQQLMTDLYRQYGPEAARIGSQVDSISREASAATDAKILDTSGRELAKTYKEIDTELNPEYYNVRSQAGSSLGQLLSGIDLDSPNIEAERLINQENQRSGTADVPSATTTVGNALNFGNERLKRMDALNQAVNSASAFMQPASNAQFNPATTALNRPTSNTGSSAFAGIEKGAGSSSGEAGQGLFSNIAGFQNNAANINANRRDVLDRLNETTSSI